MPILIKCFPDAVNSIDFSRDGMHMLLSTDNDAFHLYDLEWGQRMKVVGILKNIMFKCWMIFWITI